MLKTVSTQLALASDTLPEVLAKGNTTGGTDLAVSSGDDITFADNSKAIFGAGSDLSVYSDGTTGQVTGNAYVNGNVGIGITPTYQLDVYETAAAFAAKIKNFNGSAAGGGLWIDTRWNTADNKPLKVTTNNEGTSLLEVGGTGNVTVGTGNLVIGTSGKGIDFSATAGTGTSELLDDYEEGYFTVTVTPSTSGSIVMNTSFDTGTYTKVGNLVTVTGFVIISSVSSPVGNFKINLPITPAASTDRAADAAANVVMNLVASANIADFVATTNENDPYLFVQLGDAATTQNDSAQQLQAGTHITFSATYRGA